MSVASKNRFDALGNDIEGDEAPSGPVKTVDKTTMRSTKRNVEPQAPAKPATNTGARRAGPGGNEGGELSYVTDTTSQEFRRLIASTPPWFEFTPLIFQFDLAFRDRNAGTANNHRKPTDEVPRTGPRGGRDARVRGGRGGRFPRDRDDRHPKGIASGSEKQAAQSWGATEGEAEQKDEQAGEEIAQSELKEATAEDAQEPATPAEPEDKHVSYADYLAQQAEKKLALGESLEIRKPNEGTKADKKWANAKALVKDDDDDYVPGAGGKVKRERERKSKQLLDIDQRYVEPERPRGGRGGRGGSRGGAPRGEGQGRGRGGARGRGGESRGDFRGGRGGARENTSFALSSDAFPSLGA
ncbi:hypothetical protein F4774DRAFT_413361 [Daldinia eschscholtzii]|nr:hypothetical protein F4774DRAFT_413361 [Daldinia eschscholtzii]